MAYTRPFAACNLVRDAAPRLYTERKNAGSAARKAGVGQDNRDEK